MDERIKTQLGVIREEVHVLLSGLPSSDETTQERLSRINAAVLEAKDLVSGAANGPSNPIDHQPV